METNPHAAKLGSHQFQILRLTKEPTHTIEPPIILQTYFARKSIIRGTLTPGNFFVNIR